MQKLIDKIFSLSIKYKSRFIDIFKLGYILIAVIYVWGAKTIWLNESNAVMFYEWALAAGRTALCLYIIALIPGTAERFAIRHKTIALLRIFRRYIGISMYLLVLMHFSFLWLIPAIKTGIFFPILLFQLCGITAAGILFFLFITSNDISVRKLSLWWYRLHRFIYIAMFFIFLHVAIQRWSEWSYLMGATVLLMITSFIYSFIKFDKKPYEK